MAVNWMWIYLPLIGALIGWSTNLIAVRMLFRPRRPIRIPLFNWKIQGILPGRHKDLARLIGETVERDLMSADSLVDFIRQNGYREQLVDSVTRHVEERLHTALPRFVPQGWVLAITNYVGEVARREADRLIGEMEEGLTERLREDLPIGKMVEEKVLQFDLGELEALVLRIASTELRYIEWFGGILGAAIGVVQALIVHLTG